MGSQESEEVVYFIVFEFMQFSDDMKRSFVFLHEVGRSFLIYSEEVVGLLARKDAVSRFKVKKLSFFLCLT